MSVSRHLQPLAVAALLAACAVGASAGRASATTPSCGAAAAQSQNGNQLFVPGAGADCLRRAFAACRPAGLSIGGRGVDTQLVLSFSVRGRLGACHVVVNGSNTVFFGARTRKTTWAGTCRMVTKRPEGIVLGGCSDGDYLISPPGAPDVPNNRF